MKGKVVIGVLSVLLMLSAHVIFPVYSTTTPTTIITTKTINLEIYGENVTVTVKRYDTYQYNQWFVSFYASCEINGSEVAYLRTSRYPITKVFYNTASKYTSVMDEGLPKYWWDGILFVQAPGSDEIYIEYDHPDNYETYYPNKINTNYELQGDSKIHSHIAKYVLEEDKEKGSLITIAGVLMGVVAALLGIPELVSKIIAAFIGLIAAILTAMGQLITWFIEDIVQTELGDGWSWIWGVGHWWIFHWWWQSFGKWRDWGWFFVFVCGDPGDSGGGGAGGGWRYNFLGGGAYPR